MKYITVPGRYIVVVTLTHPDITWQYTPAEYTAEIFEMKFAEEHKAAFGQPGTLVMGTGPWEVDSIDPTKVPSIQAPQTFTDASGAKLLGTPAPRAAGTLPRCTP